MSKKIANKVRLLRFNNDEMTQEQLADRASVTRQTIAAIENNRYSPSLELAFKIADIFNKSIGDVFSYTEDKDST
jgi:putative transcriptional regulator